MGEGTKVIETGELELRITRLEAMMTITSQHIDQLVSQMGEVISILGHMTGVTTEMGNKLGPVGDEPTERVHKALDDAIIKVRVEPAGPCPHIAIWQLGDRRFCCGCDEELTPPVEYKAAGDGRDINGPVKS